MNIRTNTIYSGIVPRWIIILNLVLSTVYLSWWFVPGHIGNPLLFGLLFVGEIYHVFMALGFWFTIWPRKNPHTAVFLDGPLPIKPSVDIFITVVNEPLKVIKKTAIAARDMNYPNHNVYFLNDGRVAGNTQWEDVEKLAKELGVFCITRSVGGGAKAGNINNALKYTKGEIIVVFDADMIPTPQFLRKMIPYFTDEKVGFVQSPQYYANHKMNVITGGAWEQQELFFGPIMRGKDSSNAAFICGTNFAIRRSTLTEVGGFYQESIAEDFLTSLFVHQKKWKSHYVSEVLVSGLAPEDLLSYYKQQLRWARGSLQVLFGSNPLFKRGLSAGQKLQYLLSGLYYLNGIVVLIDITMPLIFLFFNIQPVAATTTSFALFFIPFIFFNLYTLYLASDKHVTFRALAFSQSSWVLQLKALQSLIFNENMKFHVTPKQAQQGNYLSLAYPHIVYAVIVAIGATVGIIREGINPSIVTNIAWAGFNIFMFTPFIMAAYPWKKLPEEVEQLPQLSVVDEPKNEKKYLI